MALNSQAVSRIDRPGEIDFYLAYVDASMAGDAVNDEGGAAPRGSDARPEGEATRKDAPFDPSLSTEAAFSATKAPLFVPDDVIDRWRAPPSGWPRALSWPPANAIKAMENAASEPEVGPLLARVSRGQPVRVDEWAKVVATFDLAMAEPLSGVDRQIERARDLAIFLTGSKPAALGPGEFYKVYSDQDPVADHETAKVGFACLFAAPDGEGLPYDYRYCLHAPKRPEGEPPLRGQKPGDEWEEYARQKRMFESVWRASFDRLETHDGALLRVTRGNGLACSRITPQAARLLVEEAKARGWDNIVVRGGDKFIQAVEQAAREIPGAPPVVIGRKPSFWEVIPLHPSRNMREFSAAEPSPFDAFTRVKTPKNPVGNIFDGDILDDADPGPRTGADDVNVTGFVQKQLGDMGASRRNADDDDVDVTGFVQEQLEGPDTPSDENSPRIKNRRVDDGLSP